MKRFVRILALWLVPWVLLPPATAHAQLQSSSGSITVSGGTLSVTNLYGAFNATFEEIPNGAPATVSITVQGCMRGQTCDSAADTNTSTAAAIRGIAFTKLYTSFLVTASWTGGTNATITINPATSTARNTPSGVGSGTVTNVATTSPITGGPFTTTGTIACATCVVASAPGVGLAHFAGSTQTVTSSLVNLAADVTGQLPIGAVGSAGLSGTAPVAIASTGAISLSGTAGQVPNGATGAFTPTLTLGIQNTTQGTVTIAGSAASAAQLSLNIAGATANPLVIVPGANAGTVTLTGPTTGGTIPSAVTAPITLNAAGNLGCATCVTAGSSLISNSVVLGQGAQASKVSTGFTTNGTTTLTLGVAATGSGILALAGVTSGTATCTGAAVAGTRGNPVICTNAMQLPGILIAGTKFTTNNGCTDSATAGGASGGTFTTGSTSCTEIVTMGDTLTAANGWSCGALDITTLADVVNPHQITTTTTTATFVTGTVVVGDKIQFSCTAY